jgi:hypothetical protein
MFFSSYTFGLIYFPLEREGIELSNVTNSPYAIAETLCMFAHIRVPFSLSFPPLIQSLAH